MYSVVIGGIGIPTGIFRDPGPEIPVFWVSRDNPDAGIIPEKNPVNPIPARGSLQNSGSRSRFFQNADH
jgi:hypothetical protein